MTAENLTPILAEAVASLKAAEKESAALRAALPGLILERKDWERGQRRLMRMVALLALLGMITLAYLLPLAKRNSDNLSRTSKTLEIVERVTGPTATADNQRATLGLVCQLINDNHALHGQPPEPACVGSGP